MIGIGMGLGYQTKNRIVAADHFNRADNGSNLGTTETGQTWSSTGWGIASNQAKVFSGNRALLNVSKSDGISLTTTVIAPTGSVRLLFRCQDTSNEWYFGTPGASNYILAKRSGGTANAVASTSTAAAIGDKIRVELRGALIKCYVNGALLTSYTDNFLQAQTTHGLFGDTGNIFDDFIVEEL